MDEIERQMIASALARGASFVPALRYAIERDARRAREEYDAHVARLLDAGKASEG